MGGSFSVSTNDSHISGHCDWSESNVNYTNNTSDVTVSLYLSRTNTGYTTYGTGTFYVTINGTQYSSGSESYNITYNSNTLLISRTVTITHDSNGAKTISVGWSGSGNSGVTITASSGSATLTNIPRQSSVTSSVSWTAGLQSLGVTLQTYSSSYHHTLTLQAQKNDGTWATVATRTNIGSSTTISFTQAENTIAYQQLNGYENRPAQLFCDTYDSSGNHIGSQTVQAGTIYGAAIAKMSSPSNANIGDTFNATIGPCYTGFTYTAVFTFGSFTKTFPITLPTTSGANATVSISFTTDEQTSLYNQIPSANQGLGNFEITSLYNGVAINDGYPRPAEDPNWTFYLNVAAGSSNPTFGNTYGYEDINTTTKGVTGNNQYIIQGLSTIQADFHNTDVAVGINGASINYYQFTVDSIVIKKYVPWSGPSGVVTANGSSTLSVGDYYFRYTWVDVNGESLPSPELHVNIATTGQQIALTVPAMPNGVTSTKIYCSTSSGMETYVTTITGTTYTVTANPVTGGVTCPTMMYISMGSTTSSVDTSLRVQAFDSRGNSTTTSVNMSIVPYSAPVITTSAERENGFDANTDITLSGTYSVVNVNSIPKNSLTSVQYSYKLTSLDDVPANWTTPSPNFSYSTNSGSYNATTVILSLDQTQSYDVKITVTDTMGTTSSFPMVVSKGIPAAFIDEGMNTLSVGMLPAHSNAIEVAGSFYESGTLIQDKYAPSGSVNMFAGNTAPSGYLICDGSAVSRTTYSKLFGVIGTAYGTGDNSTTFNLPNFCGRSPVGIYSADTDFNAVGKTGGEKTHILLTSEMPSHSHQTVATAGYSFYGGSPGNPAQGTGYGTAANTLRTDSQGSGYAHNNMQPYTTINFIIKT